MNSKTHNPQFEKAIKLHNEGKLDQAAVLYKKLLNLFPANIQLLNNLSILAFQQRSFEEGVKFLEKSIRLSPNQPNVLNNLANGMSELKRFEDALVIYERCISLSPNFADSHGNRGLTLQKLDRLDEALLSYDRAIALNPNYVDAYHNRGNVLHILKQLDDAIVNYRKVISLNQHHFPTYVSLGNVLKEKGNFNEALDCYNLAIRVNPQYALAHYNLSVIYFELNRLEESLASIEKAIEIRPNFPDALWNKGNLKLYLGDYQQGWELQEWRWNADLYQHQTRDFNQPAWLGKDSLQGKTLLIHAEGGFGDVIQNFRYISLFSEMSTQILFEIPKPLLSLASSINGNFKVIQKGDPLPDFDFHCPSSSLPLAFKTHLKNIPITFPYLCTNPDKNNIWSKRLGAKQKLRVGIAWSGLTGREIDLSPARNRSIPLKLLEPLLCLPFEFHSIQKDIRATDIDFLSGRNDIILHHDELLDFSDTAALISEMDLVISVDTSVAHLSCALDQKTWIALPYQTDYRWGISGDISPWYPKAKLFRQQSIGNWSDVITDIALNLKTHIN